jgi:hypothetical protein
MNPTFDLDSLRQLYIEQPEPASVRILALTLCTAFLIAVLVLVRRGKLREEYTPIWTSVAVAIMIATVWFDVVRALTRLVGAWTPSSTLFFFGLLFLLVVCLNYAVRLSGMSSQVKLLAQEVALLRARIAAADADGPGAGEADARAGAAEQRR